MKFCVRMCIFSVHIFVCILLPAIEFIDIVELKLMKKFICKPWSNRQNFCLKRSWVQIWASAQVMLRRFVFFLSPLRKSPRYHTKLASVHSTSFAIIVQCILRYHIRTFCSNPCCLLPHQLSVLSLSTLLPPILRRIYLIDLECPLGRRGGRAPIRIALSDLPRHRTLVSLSIRI